VAVPRFEPQVLSVLRGSVEPKPEGGRPSMNASHVLVMHLAGDWRRGTNNTPLLGRKNAYGFRELTHLVFEWLYEPMLVRSRRPTRR
jgi:hypothetical protein